MGFIGELKLKSYMKSFGELVRAEVALNLFEKAGIYKAIVEINSEDYRKSEPGFSITLMTCIPTEISTAHMLNSWLWTYFDKLKTNRAEQMAFMYSITLSDALSLGLIPDMASALSIGNQIEYYFITDDHVINATEPGSDLCGGPYKNFNFYGLCKQLNNAVHTVVPDDRNIVIELFYSELAPTVRVRAFSELPNIPDVLDKELEKLGRLEDNAKYYVATGPYRYPRPTFRTQVVKQPGQTIYEINFLIRANSAYLTNYKTMAYRPSCCVTNVTEYREESNGCGTIINPYNTDKQEERGITEQLDKTASKLTHTTIRTALLAASDEIKQLNISETVDEKCKSAIFQVTQTIKKYDRSYLGHSNQEMEEQITEIINKAVKMVYEEHSRERSMSDMDLSAELKAVSQFLDLK